jgi:hypothetical protein
MDLPVTFTDQLLSTLPIDDIINFCQLTQQHAKLCEDSYNIWLDRIKQDCPEYQETDTKINPNDAYNTWINCNKIREYYHKTYHKNYNLKIFGYVRNINKLIEENNLLRLIQSIRPGDINDLLFIGQSALRNDKLNILKWVLKHNLNNALLFYLFDRIIDDDIYNETVKYFYLNYIKPLLNNREILTILQSVCDIFSHGKVRYKLYKLIESDIPNDIKLQFPNCIAAVKLNELNIPKDITWTTPIVANQNDTLRQLLQYFNLPDYGDRAQLTNRLIDYLLSL